MAPATRRRRVISDSDYEESNAEVVDQLPPPGQRKRGRPAGKSRVPLTKAQRRARNAMYERERRRDQGESVRQLAIAIGCRVNISQTELLYQARVRIQAVCKKVAKKEKILKKLKRRNAKLKRKLEYLSSQENIQPVLDDDDNMSDTQENLHTYLDDDLIVPKDQEPFIITKVDNFTAQENQEPPFASIVNNLTTHDLQEPFFTSDFSTDDTPSPAQGMFEDYHHNLEMQIKMEIEQQLSLTTYSDIYGGFLQDCLNI